MVEYFFYDCILNFILNVNKLMKVFSAAYGERTRTSVASNFQFLWCVFYYALHLLVDILDNALNKQVLYVVSYQHILYVFISLPFLVVSSVTSYCCSVCIFDILFLCKSPFAFRFCLNVFCFISW